MWYVAHTLARYEKLIIPKLNKKGFQVYYPHIPEGFPPVEQPLFPRYIFLRPRSSGLSPSAALEVKGIVRLLGYGPGKRPLEDEVVEEIRKLVAEIRSRGGLIRPEPGDTVRLESGIFEGFEGTLLQFVKGRNRVKLLLKLLGETEITVEVPAENISHQKVKIPRRTRGRGRFIKGARPLHPCCR